MKACPAEESFNCGLGVFGLRKSRTLSKYTCPHRSEGMVTSENDENSHSKTRRQASKKLHCSLVVPACFPQLSHTPFPLPHISPEEVERQAEAAEAVGWEGYGSSKKQPPHCWTCCKTSMQKLKAMVQGRRGRHRPAPQLEVPDLMTMLKKVLTALTSLLLRSQLGQRPSSSGGLRPCGGPNIQKVLDKRTMAELLSTEDIRRLRNVDRRGR